MCWPQHAPHPAGRGADAEQLEELDQTGELNIGIGIPKVGSFRLSGFKQRNSIAAVVRCMPVKIPSIDTLNLPPILAPLSWKSAA
jgi:twitching motility protein PilU